MWQTLLILDITHNASAILRYAYQHHWLLSFMPLSLIFILFGGRGGGVTNWAEVKPCCIHFLAHLHKWTDQDDSLCGVELIQVRHIYATFEGDLFNGGK